MLSVFSSYFHAQISAEVLRNERSYGLRNVDLDHYYYVRRFPTRRRRRYNDTRAHTSLERVRTKTVVAWRSRMKHTMAEIDQTPPDDNR